VPAISTSRRSSGGVLHLAALGSPYAPPRQAVAWWSAWLIAVAVVAAGCGEGPATPGCEPAIGRGMALSADEPITLGSTPAEREDMRRLAVARCRADAWPAPVVRCLVRAADVPAYQGCMARLPAAAYEALVNAMAAGMAGRGAAAGGAAGGAAPASGQGTAAGGAAAASGQGAAAGGAAAAAGGAAAAAGGAAAAASGQGAAAGGAAAAAGGAGAAAGGAASAAGGAAAGSPAVR
jgi:hypothetical protein